MSSQCYEYFPSFVGCSKVRYTTVCFRSNLMLRNSTEASNVQASTIFSLCLILLHFRPLFQIQFDIKQAILFPFAQLYKSILGLTMFKILSDVQKTLKFAFVQFCRNTLSVTLLNIKSKVKQALYFLFSTLNPASSKHYTFSLSHSTEAF